MKLWLILILLSLIIYLLIQRSISKVTTTPAWLCWLAIMLPTFTWIAWAYFVGEDQPLPILLVIVPLVLGIFLYGWLIQIGKPKEETVAKKPLENKKIVSQPTEEVSQPLSPIDSQEEKTLRNCFPWNVYYLQQIDYRPQAILCRGKLKAVPEEAYSRIKKNVEQAFGDRFFIIFQESFRGQPFFALVPNPQAQASTQVKDSKDKVNRPELALGLLLITLLTTTKIGLDMSNIALDDVIANPSLIFSGLSYSLALISIIGIHELGHYFVSSYYKIRTTLPYFIPFPFFLGTIGAFVQRRSPVPHRRALFDVAIAGPIAGLLITLPILFWGFSLSEVVPLKEPNILHFDSLDLRFSFLLALAGKLALGSQLQPEMGLNLHPLAVAGYIGILITALNLMPIGSLDGGHIIHAVFGQRMAIAIGQITRLLSILFAMVHNYFWIWTIILWLMPLIDQPALNDVTELDNWRDFSGLIALTILVMILLPLPTPIAQWLNI